MKRFTLSALLSKRALGLALAAVSAAVVIAGPATTAQASGCGVSGGKLWCSNRVAPVKWGPSYYSETGDVLRSTHSWFACWTTGQLHEGGNTTWYYTQGDDSGMWGYVPAVALDTSSAFDANPTGNGLRHC
ncbi:hypothetical protein ACIRPK_36545 [Kitasatospora sp. NPDC101801]|uniref:hypothetical protein n=1 Tax=Kitasatospora sp. NPDC101801 TaxID=3364103 RepID=UPI00380F1ADA